ncbi:MAG: hypothetical protein WAO74_12285 [Polaribacter sp.]|uniref:hypothetical protein n=1 Tax=Polaribacter sp. TaxID=1920175 RepID=UPI003BB11E62
MELTQDQIQKIERFLNNNNITYVDIRIEAYDHIVTDILEKTKNQNMSFEIAFNAVTNSWRKHIRETSSFYFGLYYSAPKLVIEKAKKSFKKFYFLYMSAYFFPLIFIQYLKVPFIINIINTIFPLIQTIGVFATFFFVFLMIKKWKTKEKTTYSFVLRTQTASLAFGVIITFKFLFTKSNYDLSTNAIWIAFTFAFLISTYIYYIFYQKHLEALKTYKIS